jgi:hypothetical protein
LESVAIRFFSQLSSVVDSDLELDFGEEPL